jgi:hypothetical protein
MNVSYKSNKTITSPFAYNLLSNTKLAMTSTQPRHSLLIGAAGLGSRLRPATLKDGGAAVQTCAAARRGNAGGRDET